MAVNIGSLPNIATLADNAAFVAEQQGEAGHVTGRQLKAFAEEAGRRAAASIAKGDPGEDFKVLGYFPTLEALQAAITNPEAGHAYGVGTEAPYDIYIFDGVGKTWVNNGSIQGPQGPQGESFKYEDFTPEQLEELRGPAGKDGEDGSSIQSIIRTAGNGAPGTTDTYTVTMTDGSTSTFQVYNGKDGEGAGDMSKSVYDPTGKAQDIFKYVDDKLKDVDFDVTADEVTFDDGETFQQKYDSGELAGAPATINGVKALTLNATSPIKATQSGDTLTLELDGDLPSGVNASAYTLAASGWVQGSDGLYAQTIAVAGVTTDPKQFIMVDVQQTGVDIAADDEAAMAWLGNGGTGPANKYKTQGDGTITFHAEEAPAINIPLDIGVGGV